MKLFVLHFGTIVPVQFVSMGSELVIFKFKGREYGASRVALDGAGTAYCEKLGLTVLTEVGVAHRPDTAAPSSTCSECRHWHRNGPTDAYKRRVCTKMVDMGEDDLDDGGPMPGCGGASDGTGNHAAFIATPPTFSCRLFERRPE